MERWARDGGNRNPGLEFRSLWAPSIRPTAPISLRLKGLVKLADYDDPVPN